MTFSVPTLEIINKEEEEEEEQSFYPVEKKSNNMISRKRRNCILRNPENSSDSKKSLKLDIVELHHPSVMDPCPTPDGNGVEIAKEPVSSGRLPEESGREKLQRHRSDVAGQVWIPEIWGQEELLKDWIDCAAFDRSLVPTGIMSARDALVAER